MKFQISSTSSDNTEEIAEKIGARLKGGEVIELVSDLGGGKTVFAKGLAKGAGSNEIVSSPTFTLSKVYRTPSFVINHFDFYRLHDAGIMSEELKESIDNEEAVTVIEWADVAKNVLPKEHLTININNLGENKRDLIFNYTSNLSYLLEGLK